MARHRLEPQRANLTGHFSRDLAPVLTVEPGDTVAYRTMDPAWALGPPTGPDDPWPRLEPRDPRKDAGHALIGPVAIRGAAPGMALEIHVHRIVPGEYGWTHIHGRDSPLTRALGIDDGQSELLIWSLDKHTMTGLNQHGHRVALRPFLGVMGMPPAEQGIHATGPPRREGGNFDCKDLVAGTSLFLPVAVEGGLFLCGDGHARQGDGESCGEAIECPMEHVELTFELHERFPFDLPCARTPEGWLTMGLHQDLKAASQEALAAMTRLIARQLDVSLKVAFGLASISADLHITQIANRTHGVHMLWPHEDAQTLGRTNDGLAVEKVASA